ncbi:MAG: hypothetical protein RLZZ272_1755 [Actinomycetota bacterium]
MDPTIVLEGPGAVRQGQAQQLGVEPVDRERREELVEVGDLVLRGGPAAGGVIGAPGRAQTSTTVRPA